MSLTYSTYVSQLANLMVISSADSNFTTFLPGCIDYSEQRLYRELDLLKTRVTDATASLSSGNRNFALPTTVGTFLVVEGANVISPAGTASSAGSRNPLTFVSREYIDSVYPNNTTNLTTPSFAAMVDNANIIVGPTPDAAYVVEVIGTQRPTPLSASNSSTILTQMLPDLFVAASMVFATAYQRDFGAQSDNPQAAQSWENQFKTLFQSADTEELRKRFQSQGWTTQIPNPIATPPRV